MDESIIHTYRLSFINLLFDIFVLYFIEIQRSKLYKLSQYMNSELIYVWDNHSNWSAPNEIVLGDSQVK